MVEAVMLLLSDRQCAADLGTDARARVMARYGWDARLAPLDDLIGVPARFGEAA
jgi:hypothetical protein